MGTLHRDDRAKIEVDYDATVLLALMVSEQAKSAIEGPDIDYDLIRRCRFWVNLRLAQIERFVIRPYGWGSFLMWYPNGRPVYIYNGSASAGNPVFNNWTAIEDALPDYTKNAAAGCRVIKKLNKVFHLDFCHGEWTAYFGGINESGEAREFDSAALAICAAALQWYRIEEGV